MSPAQLAFWIVVISCIATLLHQARAGFSRARASIVITLLILLAAGVVGLLLPDRAKWLVVAAWMVLGLVPTLLMQVTTRRLNQQRYAEARFYARLVRLLHPFDTWRWQPAIMGIFDLAQRGETDRAMAAMSRLLGDRRVPGYLRPTLRQQLYRLAGDWEGILTNSQEAARAGDPAAVALRVRAYGETGRLRDMVAAFRASHPAQGPMHHYCQLFLLAFCGRRAAVAELLGGALAGMERDLRTFWLATAELAGEGPAGAAPATLNGLATTATDALVRRAAARRLSAPPARPQDMLGPEEWQAVAAAEAELRREAAYGTRPSGAGRRSYVVIGLIALNLAAYFVEFYTGADQDIEALYQLGLMWPPAIVFGGEWWRLLTACFLHAGVLHLTLNMLALLVLGPWVERMLGHWRMLAVYLGAGIGSMAAVLGLIELGWMMNEALLGASGAIFGIVGAQAVLFAHGWRRLGSKLAVRRLQNIGLIVLLQIGFDLSFPQISIAAHIFGLIIGMGLTALLMVAGIGERLEGRAG